MLPCGQILSVDPTGLEFPRKGKEKRKKKNLRKLTEANADPQLLELNPKTVTVNTPRGPKTEGRVWGTDVDNGGNGVSAVLLFFLQIT